MKGRPRNTRTEIVPPVNVLDHAAIRAEFWTISILSNNLPNTEAAMVWLARRQLLKNTLNCDQCHELCKLHTYNKGVDSKRWRCDTCGRTKSLRTDSLFVGSHLSLRQIVILLFCFAKDFPQTVAKEEAAVEHPDTVMKWFRICREVIGRFIEVNPTTTGGFDVHGEPMVVEIDESKFFRRKSHRGAWHVGHWVFGGIERRSRRFFLVEVPDRRARTLEAHIVEHVLPGTHIMTDNWAAYRNVSRLRYGIYQHSTIRHAAHFVDPVYPEIHTQNIENLWMRAKRKLRRQFGTSRPLFPSYLNEFKFREEVSGANVFAEFLIVIIQLYPVL